MFNVLLMVLITIGIQSKYDALKMIITKVIFLLSMIFIFVLMLWKLREVHFGHSPASSETRSLVKPCEELSNMSVSLDYFIDNAADLLALNDEENIFKALFPYFGFIMLMTAFHGIKMRQEIKQKERKTKPEVVFQEVTRENADESLANLFKFLVNFGFHNLGSELTLCMFLIVIFNRLNIFAIFYTIWFVLLLIFHRTDCVKLWRVATISVAASIIFQCVILAVFIIINPCYGGMSPFVIYLYENFHDHPEILIYDIVLLTLMNCQVRMITASIHRPCQ